MLKSYVLKTKTEIKGFISEMLNEYSASGNSYNEKVLFTVILPLLVPVAIMGIVIGFERTKAGFAGILISLLFIAVMIIKVIIEYGPGILSALNSLVNG